VNTKMLLGTAMLGLAAAACQQKTAPVSATEDNCNGASKKCRVTVTSVDPGTRTGTVNIQGLKLDRGFHNIHIFWILKAGCSFNEASGDGVFLKEADDGQFGERFATDDENDNPGHNANGKKFHWKGRNDANAGHKYPYKMQFHCDSGAPYVVDPWIQNG
jgi:hypothetical protein